MLSRLTGHNQRKLPRVCLTRFWSPVCWKGTWTRQASPFSSSALDHPEVTGPKKTQDQQLLRDPLGDWLEQQPDFINPPQETQFQANPKPSNQGLIINPSSHKETPGKKAGATSKKSRKPRKSAKHTLSNLAIRERVVAARKAARDPEKKPAFDPYWTPEKLATGLEDGDVKMGILEIKAFRSGVALIGGYPVSDFFRRNRAFHGDTAYFTVSDDKASIVGIFQRNLKNTLALLSYDGETQKWKAQPRDQRLPAFRVTSEISPEFDRSWATIQFDYWPEEARMPLGTLKEVLGRAGDYDVEAKAILAWNGVESRESPAVSAEIRYLLKEYSKNLEEEFGKRLDLRQLWVFTIDPASAKDLDDAISCEIAEDGQSARVGVHIADVSHFVKPDSALEAQAQKRATSVYLIDRVIPMLPTELSDGLCSLLPQVDRLACSVFFTLSKDGQLLDEPVDFRRSVIHSHQRLAYHEVDEFLEGKPLENIGKDLSVRLHFLAQATRALQKGRGSLRLFRSSVEFSLNDQGHPVDVNIQNSSVSRSHSLIEELMIMTNYLVAKKTLGDHPHVLRRHKDTETRVSSFVSRFLKVPGERGLAAILKDCQTQYSGAALEAISFKALTEFEEAQYFVPEPDSEDSDPSHWGVSLPHYMHFTSPIRRYADIMVHRTLFENVKVSREKLMQACSHCNTRKRLAVDCQTQHGDFFLTEFLKTRVDFPVESNIVCTLIPPSDGHKAACELYLPIVQSIKSTSLESLGLNFIKEEDQTFVCEDSNGQEVRLSPLMLETDCRLPIGAQLSINL